jgi:hypothetical protein
MPFVILGTFEENSGKQSILNVFVSNSEENEKVKNPSWKLHLTASPIPK